jgi:glycosyltransferase involved in cell wall biosynthesis
MITIIVPCYNEVESVSIVLSELSRVFRNAQIIVIDNNSNDGSADLILKLDI